MAKKNNKIIVNFGPALDEKGGVVTVIRNIMNLKFDFKVENIETTKEDKKLITFIKCLYITINKILNKEIDIAHIHMASKGSFYRKSLIVLICKIFKKPVIIHVHGACFKEYYNDMNKLMRNYCNYVFNKADKIIVLSEQWKKFFLQIVNENKISIVANFVFLPKNDKFKKKENNILNILFLGRLGERKGTYDLIKSTKLLKDNDININLILAGDGNIEECKRLINENGLNDRVEITGWIEKSEKEKYLKNADIVVLPSYYESFGLSLIEAMSYKIPVIGTWGGEVKEVIRNGIDGILINPGNIEEISEKIEILVNNKELRYKFSINGYERVVDKFSDITAIKKLEKIYNELKIEEI